MSSDAQLPKSIGADLITAERARQVTDEGWTALHDDRHQLTLDASVSDLSEAAACYLLHNRGEGFRARPGEKPLRWPWEREAWKPTPDDRVRQLVKAGALIAAEIDRLSRASSTEVRDV